MPVTRPIYREMSREDYMARATMAVRSIERARRGEHPEFAHGPGVSMPNMEGTLVGPMLGGADFNPTSNKKMIAP